VWTGVLYLRSHRRRPVCLGPQWGMRDVQAEAPAGWCSRCGREVYAREQLLCRRCIARKGEESNEDNEKSVSKLSAGHRSDQLQQ